jgi:hypothetical protein
MVKQVRMDIVPTRNRRHTAPGPRLSSTMLAFSTTTNAADAPDLKELSPLPYVPANSPVNGHTVLTQRLQRKGGPRRMRTLKRLKAQLAKLVGDRDLAKRS